LFSCGTERIIINKQHYFKEKREKERIRNENLQVEGVKEEDNLSV